MRIAASRAIALTVRPPRPAPEPMPTVAPMPARAAAPVRPALPEAGFVMQLIAAAMPTPPPHAAGHAYGDAGRATSPPRTGDLVARSI